MTLGCRNHVNTDGKLGITSNKLILGIPIWDEVDKIRLSSVFEISNILNMKINSILTLLSTRTASKINVK